MSEEYKKILAPHSTTLKCILPGILSVLADCCSSEKRNEYFSTKEFWTTEHLFAARRPIACP